MPVGFVTDEVSFSVCEESLYVRGRDKWGMSWSTTIKQSGYMAPYLAAAILRVSRVTIHNMIVDGRLTARVEHGWRAVSASSVIDQWRQTHDARQ